MFQAKGRVEEFVKENSWYEVNLKVKEGYLPGDRENLSVIASDGDFQMPNDGVYRTNS